MRNSSFGKIVKHLESVGAILNGTKTDCGCGVVFAFYASTTFRMVKKGMKPERGAVVGC